MKAHPKCARAYVPSLVPKDRTEYSPGSCCWKRSRSSWQLPQANLNGRWRTARQRAPGQVTIRTEVLRLTIAQQSWFLINVPPIPDECPNPRAATSRFFDRLYLQRAWAAPPVLVQNAMPGNLILQVLSFPSDLKQPGRVLYQCSAPLIVNENSA
jgi:hypothetical protein